MGVHKYVVPIDLTLFWVPNYSNAIFVTPSVNYASCFGIEEIQQTDLSYCYFASSSKAKFLYNSSKHD